MLKVRRLFRKRHPPPGAKPGTLMIDGEAAASALRVIVYGPGQFDERTVDDVKELTRDVPPGTVTWIDVQGLGHEETLRALATQFNIHPLALEDVVNVPQRPKAETYDDNLFIIAPMVTYEGEWEVDREQVSLFMGKNFAITFQERSGDLFDPVRTRIRQGGPIFRSGGSAYLAYALLDALIDGFYPVLEGFGEQLEELELRVTGPPRPGTVEKAHLARRELLMLRRGVGPLRDVVNTLLRDDIPHLDERVKPHLRDCYDHCAQIIDVLETYREVAGGLMDAYLSSVANRQNEVMKTLTIMATIFIPLSFLAGVYGMNFHYMPELHKPWAYPALLGLMAVVAGGLLLFFRRKGWIGSDGQGTRDEDA